MLTYMKLLVIGVEIRMHFDIISFELGSDDATGGQFGKLLSTWLQLLLGRKVTFIIFINIKVYRIINICTHQLYFKLFVIVVRTLYTFRSRIFIFILVKSVSKLHSEHLAIFNHFVYRWLAISQTLGF